MTPALPPTQWLDALASDEPTPGGGAAAAMSVATGAALAAMGARRSGSQLADADEVTARAELLRHEALHLADADGDAYRHLLRVLRDARRAPSTPDGVVREAFEGATDVPERVAELAVEVAELCARIAREGNPSLRGDAVTGALLGHAAASAVAVLVELNVIQGGLPRGRVDRARALVDRASRLATDLTVAVRPA